MKKKYAVILILTISLYSCYNKVSGNKEKSKTTDIEKNIIPKKKIEPLIKTGHSNLFNNELIGLTKDSKNEKKYFVDSSSACFCNTPSILLKEKKAYLFSYCKDTLPPLSKDHYYTYDIIETKEINNGLLLSLKNKKDKTLTLIFNKSKNEFIYELTVKGEFPSNYIGNNVCTYFTFDSTKFEAEDCGDFDG